MKFNIKAVEQPATPPAEPKNTAKIMNDAQFAEFVDGLEMFLDSYAAGVDATEAEQLVNLEGFAEYMASAEPQELTEVIQAEEELSALFDGSLENFKTLVNANVAAMEGKFKDFLAEGPGIVSLIAAFVKRNNHTVAYLKPALEQVEGRIEKIPNERYQFRLFKMNVASKYLPSFDKFAKAASAVSALLSYVKSVKPEEYKPKDAAATLAGSIFAGGKKPSNLGAAKTIGMLLPGINTFAYAHEHADVRTRGWSSEEAMRQGLKTCKGLVASIESASKIAETLKAKQPASKEEAAGIKRIVKVLTFITREAGFLCRGYIVVAKKLSSGYLGRLAQGLVD